MRSHRLRHAASLALLCATCAGAQGASNDITVAITPQRLALGKDDDVVLTLTFTNTTAAPVRLLQWQLPFGDIEAPLFDVTRDGLQARYLGIRAKRAAPAPTDYIVLEPGAARSVKVELSALYDMSITGAYTV